MTLKKQIQDIQKEVLSPTPTQEALTKQAHDMIKEFIIPKFFEAARRNPNANYLFVNFMCNAQQWNYSSSLGQSCQSPYPFAVVQKAIEVASDYEICATVSDYGISGTLFNFSIQLQEQIE